MDRKLSKLLFDVLGVRTAMRAMALLLISCCSLAWQTYGATGKHAENYLAKTFDESLG